MRRQASSAVRSFWQASPAGGDLRGIITWLESECDILGVDIRLNTYADAAMVAAENPDVVIIATGGLPDTDWVTGGAPVFSTWDILSGMANLTDQSLFMTAPAGQQHSPQQTGFQIMAPM